FHRTAAKPEATDIIPSDLVPAYIDVSGRWDSNVEKVYQITQNLNNFSWIVENSDETATGTINGKEVSATWKIGGVPGSGKASITQVGATLRAIRIEWDNGCIFYRTAAKPQVTQIDISGRWESNVGKVYQITQNLNNFSWIVENSDETASGTIKDKEVSATWKIGGFPGSGKARITQVDATGRAIRIEWDNGCIFHRAAAKP
ncbi:MAG: hypothetical protein ACYS8Y_11290, partial [Planctomycetota bacterium]